VVAAGSDTAVSCAACSITPSSSASKAGVVEVGALLRRDMIFFRLTNAEKHSRWASYLAGTDWYGRLDLNQQPAN
jgi:hypothetical protein